MRFYVLHVVLIVVVLLSGVPVAFAQGEAHIDVSTSIPGNAPADSPVGFVANLYQFALLIGGLLAFGMLVYGGIKYIVSAGNPSAKSDAKDAITQALLGLLLLLGAYLVLFVINPELVTLELPVLEQVDPVDQSLARGGGGGDCKPLENTPCSTENLQSTCFSENAEQASSICRGESGGASIASGVDKCEPNGEPVSFGLFQINISANTITMPDGSVLDCRAAFEGGPYTYSDHTCTVVDQALYNACKNAALNPDINIANACRIGDNGAHWGPWGANSKCNFPR